MTPNIKSKIHLMVILCSHSRYYHTFFTSADLILKFALNYRFRFDLIIKFWLKFLEVR